jgi:hypothetical protein
MCAAALVTVTLLRHRQRARAAGARQDLQHGAQMLARPLPRWLSGESQTARPPAVITTPDAEEEQLLDVRAAALLESRHDEPELELEIVDECPAEPELRAAEVASNDLPEIQPDERSSEPLIDAVSADVCLDDEPQYGHLAADDAPLQSPDDMPPAFLDSSSITPANHTFDSGDQPASESLQLQQESAPGDVSDADALDESDTYRLRNEDRQDAPVPHSDVLDEGSYIGGWTQDDLPYEESDVAAVQEAADALQDSPNPMGLDPRVAALREQLSNLFGVSLDSQSAMPVDPQTESGLEDSFSAEPEPAQDETAVTDAVPSSIVPSVGPVEEAAPSDESDPVRSWLAYLKNRNAPAAAAAEPVQPSATPETPGRAAVSTAPGAEIPPIKSSAPLIRQNKSAVRLEISHLRDVANRHTRGVLAVKASEQKARLLWFMSGAGMVVLCFVSMALLKSPFPLIRWCGWAFLCGAAVSLGVCVNSFQKLKSVADQEDPEGAVPATDRPAHEATAGPAAELMTPEMEARLEALMDSSRTEQPREVNA